MFCGLGQLCETYTTTKMDGMRFYMLLSWVKGARPQLYYLKYAELFSPTELKLACFYSGEI